MCRVGSHINNMEIESAGYCDFFGIEDSKKGMS
jgi:hypothetical protein